MKIKFGKLKFVKIFDKDFIKYFLWSYLWIGTLYLCSFFIDKVCWWMAALINLGVSLPFILVFLYILTVRKLEKSLIFSDESFIKRIFTGKFFGSILVIIGTYFLISFPTLIQFKTLSLTQFIAVFLTPLVYYVIYKKLILKWVAHIRKSLAKGKAIFWSSTLASGLMCIFMGIVTYIDVFYLNHYTDLLGQLEKIENYYAQSYVLTLVLKIAQYINLLQFWMIEKAYSISPVASIIIGIIGTFSFFFNLCISGALIILNKDELKRIVLPVKEEIGNEEMSKSTVWIWGIIGSISLTICIGLSYKAENLVKNYYGVIEANLITPGIRIVKKIIEVEEINGEYYKAGTIAMLSQIKEKYEKLWDKLYQNATQMLAEEVDQGFYKMEKNVDAYLDWYYSLSGEYARLLNLIKSLIAKKGLEGFEEYMKTKFEEYIRKGEPFKEFGAKYETIKQTFAILQEQYQKEIENLLRKNKVTIPQSNETVKYIVEVKDRISNIYDFTKLPTFEDTIGFKMRMIISGIGAGAGGIGGYLLGKKISKIILQKLEKRLIKKGMFKMTTKMFLKEAITKFPKLGALLSLLLGPAIDELLLKLDEYWNRDKFKNQIIAELENLRLEIRNQLLAANY